MRTAMYFLYNRINAIRIFLAIKFPRPSVGTKQGAQVGKGFPFASLVDDAPALNQNFHGRQFGSDVLPDEFPNHPSKAVAPDRRAIANSRGHPDTDAIIGARPAHKRDGAAAKAATFTKQGSYPAGRQTRDATPLTRRDGLFLCAVGC